MTAPQVYGATFGGVARPAPGVVCGQRRQPVHVKPCHPRLYAGTSLRNGAQRMGPIGDDGERSQKPTEASGASVAMVPYSNCNGRP